MSADLEEGFEGRFDELYGVGYRVGYRLLGVREDAQDVAAEAVARALARWRSVAGYAAPWVARVATNLALDMIRARGTATRAQPGLVSRTVAVDPGVEARLDLVAALRTLPRRQREVVALRFLADRSEAETAATLGCSVGTVKSSASRGIASLRAALADSPAAGAVHHVVDDPAEAAGGSEAGADTAVDLGAPPAATPTAPRPDLTRPRLSRPT